MVINIKKFSGEDLKILRKKHEFTQAGLGNILGISQVSISRWENGTENISKPYQILFQLFFEKIEKVF